MEFIVLKCCQCSMFQVHQQKKAKKWECKMCGTKQSIIKVYFMGPSSDCRKVVQQNNMKQSGENALREVVNNSHYVGDEELKRKSVFNEDGHQNENVSTAHSTQPSVSKWARYASPPHDNSGPNDDDSCPEFQPSWNVKAIKESTKKRSRLTEKHQQKFSNENPCERAEASSCSKRYKAEALHSKWPSKENTPTSKWGQFRSNEDDCTSV